MSASASAFKLLDLIQSQRITAVIYVAAELGIAELLRNGPRTADELAATTSADRDALKRLLTALSTIGVCARNSDGRYSITSLGAALDGSADWSVKGWAVFEGEMLAKTWNGLLDSVRSGRTAAQLAGVENSFELMARSASSIAIFNAAMTDLTRMVTYDILEAYDFIKVSHLLDVGGGTGEFVAAATKRYPRMRATVFDLPRCADAATTRLQSACVGDRATFMSGNFFNTEY